jgi:hypothetical protein
MKKVIRLTESDIERLVTKILKEEDEENSQGGESHDNPNDVQKFLDLADKYLFQKYGKIAGKIDTPKEKAMLISALAKKWGIDTSDLSRVKSVLTKEEREILDEVGYDSPEVFAQHAGKMMGNIRGMFNNLTGLVKQIEDSLGQPKNQHVQALDKLSFMIQGLKTGLRNLTSEMSERDLVEASKEFADNLGKFERRIRTLVTAATSFSDEDFRRELERFLIKLTTSMMKYGKVILDVDKRFYQRVTGRSRGDYGSGYDI